jgi:hypothetical protein
MASGINSTFRQIGIATGIALLGTLFANRIHTQLSARLHGIPALAGHTGAITTAVKSGQLKPVLMTLPPDARGWVTEAARSAFTSALDLILLVGAVIAISCGLVATLTIRSKDFVPPASPAGRSTANRQSRVREA